MAAAARCVREKMRCRKDDTKVSVFRAGLERLNKTSFPFVCFREGLGGSEVLFHLH